jgi:hypothetical protein
MAAGTEIDPEAARVGLAASADSRVAYAAKNAISLPQGQYVGATNTFAEGLISARLADLSARIEFGVGAAQASMASYETTEEANAKALKT